MGHHAQRGTVGSTPTRLETDDDFFMGSYKHKIKWSLDALKLTNRENACSFKFTIFTGTLQHYPTRTGADEDELCHLCCSVPVKIVNLRCSFDAVVVCGCK